jgi:hypothetical protein
MDVEGYVNGRFGPVRERFAEVIGGQRGTGAAFYRMVRGPAGG